MRPQFILSFLILLSALLAASCGNKLEPKYICNADVTYLEHTSKFTIIELKATDFKKALIEQYCSNECANLNEDEKSACIKKCNAEATLANFVCKDKDGKDVTPK